MRKAPVYLLIDTSKSMEGEPITSVNLGIQNCIKALRTDPESMEKAHVCIITFSEKAEIALPLTYLPEISTVPEFKVNSTTSMGDAIRLLNESLAKDLVPNDGEQQGDYKAFVVLFTDGRPTDKPVLEEEVKKLNRKKINYFIAATTSDSEEVKKILTEVTGKEENVIYLPASSPDVYKQFFQWVTQSIGASMSRGNKSKAIDDNGGDDGGDVGELPPLPNFNDEGDLL